MESDYGEIKERIDRAASTIDELPRYSEFEHEGINGEGKNTLGERVSEYPSNQDRLRPLRDNSSTIDWNEFWGVTKPVVNVWVTAFWAVIVMPGIWELEGFIEILRELPPIMISFFLTGMIWMFYLIGKHRVMVWFWVVNMLLMGWLY